jgi:hypothetical protein
MAEIGNVRPTNPINWPRQPKISPADKKKQQDSNQKNQNKNDSDDPGDSKHIDEYA